MKTRARAVVIGGGVGGCSILYWLARLGWDDVVLVERADLTSGSTFHSAGLVGQLRSSLGLTRMMMSSVELYRTLGGRGRSRDGLARGRLAAARVVAGADGGDHAPGGLGEDVRAPARADLGAGGAGAVPADVDRRRPRRRLSADRRLHRPEPAHVRARRGRAQARGGGPHEHARPAIRVRNGRVTGVVTDRGEIETEVVVNAGGMFAREIGALAGVTCRSCRWRTSTCHEAERAPARHADDARPVAARLLPAGVGRPRHGRLRARPRAWSLDGIPADFNGRLLEEDWPRFEPLLENAIVRVPVARGGRRS